MIEVNRQVEDKRTALAQAAAMARSTVENDDRQLRLQQRDLEAHITAVQAGLNAYRAELDQLSVLQEETAMRQNLFDDLLTRLGQEEIDTRLDATRVVQVDPADAGADPVNRMYLLFIAASGLLGLCAAISLVVATELFAGLVRGPDQFQQLTGLRILGLIPRIPGYQPLGREGDPDQPAKLVEAVRCLRGSLRLTGARPELPTVLLLVAPAPRCGTSSLTARLGVALAAAGRRVLLIDADLRKPALHLQLGEPGDQGLAKLLCGDEVQPAPTSYPRLHLMPAGPGLVSASELLHGERMRILLAEWRERYDHILIDAPSLVNAAADVVALGEASDAILLVVQDAIVSRDILLSGMHHLRLLQQRLAGLVVLTQDSSLSQGLASGQDSPAPPSMVTASAAGSLT